jgi:hypothetical protein
LTIALFFSPKSKRVPLGQKKTKPKKNKKFKKKPNEKKKKREKGFLKWWPSGIIEKIMKKKINK